MAKVSGPSERETYVHSRDVEVIPSKRSLHSSHGGPGSGARGVASLMEDVTAVHNGRCHSCQRNQSPISDSLRQRQPPTLLSTYTPDLL
jgi:hypothetical protein